MFRIMISVKWIDKRDAGRESEGTHFAILGQIYLQRLGVVLETQRRHGEEDILSIDRLPLLLLALL
jgi:hypothetical protein